MRASTSLPGQPVERPLLTVAWVAVLAFFFAQVEIQIEGGAGWAAALPTWRIEQLWLLDIFWGGRAMTGYHAWIFSFMVLMFHFPLAFLQTWSWRLQARALAKALVVVGPHRLLDLLCGGRRAVLAFVQGRRPSTTRGCHTTALKTGNASQVQSNQGLACAFKPKGTACPQLCSVPAGKTRHGHPHAAIPMYRSPAWAHQPLFCLTRAMAEPIRLASSPMWLGTISVVVASVATRL